MSNRACFPGQYGELGERGLNKGQRKLIAAEIAAMAEIAAVGVPV